MWTGKRTSNIKRICNSSDEKDIKASTTSKDWYCIPVEKLDHSSHILTSSCDTWASLSPAKASCFHCSVSLQPVQFPSEPRVGYNPGQERAMTGWGGKYDSKMLSNQVADYPASIASCHGSADTKNVWLSRDTTTKNKKRTIKIFGSRNFITLTR